MSEPETCPICETAGCTRAPQTRDSTRFDCPRCGAFELMGSAESVLVGKLNEVPLRRSIMSHTLRRMQRRGQTPPEIDTYGLASFWSDRLPTPQQQADNLIVWVGDNQPSTFKWVNESFYAIGATIGLEAGRDSPSWTWLHTQLEPKGLYELKAERDRYHLRLTMVGWERYAALKQTNAQSRTAFMAMQFGDDELNWMVNNCFRDAVERTGFVLRLLTDEQPAGLIDNQLRAAILSARFLVADLTHGNRGAYWEAGFAEGLNLPVIYTCRAKEWEKSKSHFDTNHMKTIIWKRSTSERAGKELTATIRATLRAEAKQIDDTD